MDTHLPDGGLVGASGKPPVPAGFAGCVIREAGAAAPSPLRALRAMYRSPGGGPATQILRTGSIPTAAGNWRSELPRGTNPGLGRGDHQLASGPGISLYLVAIMHTRRRYVVTCDSPGPPWRPTAASTRCRNGAPWTQSQGRLVLTKPTKATTDQWHASLRSLVSSRHLLAGTSEGEDQHGREGPVHRRHLSGTVVPVAEVPPTCT